jgi:hypothetical protein
MPRDLVIGGWCWAFGFELILTVLQTMKFKVSSCQPGLEAVHVGEMSMERLKMASAGVVRHESAPAAFTSALPSNFSGF